MTIFLFTSSCQQESKEQTAGISSQTTQQDIYSVKTILPELKTFTYPIEAKGKLLSRYEVKLAFPLSGQLKAFNVANGTIVKKGQLIAQLVNLEHQLEVNAQKARLAQVWNDYQNQLAEYDHIDTTAFPDWNRIKQNFRHKFGVEASRVAVEQAEYKLSQTYLYAPVDGIIEGLNIKAGNWISPQEEMCTILDHRQFEVITNVLEFDLGELKMGDPARVSPLAYPGMEIKARISEINPSVDERGYVQVRLTLPYQQRLLHGMSVRAVLEVPQSESLMVPKEAVVNKSGRPVIFTVEDGLAKWLYVTTGKDNGEEIEILDGLKEGMPVIVTNNLQLAHDSPVKLEGKALAN